MSAESKLIPVAANMRLKLVHPSDPQQNDPALPGILSAFAPATVFVISWVGRDRDGDEVAIIEVRSADFSHHLPLTSITEANFVQVTR